MATYLPQHENFFNEIFNDDESDEEFEGFEPDDLADSSDEEDNENPVNFMANWQDGDRPRTDMGFTGVPGLNVDMPADQRSPLDFFNLFIKDEDFQTMADETNRYAEQYLQRNEENLKPSSRFRNWVKTTMAEMKVFIAMTIAMGLVVQLDISEYWTTSEVNSTPFFPSVMPRDRFWLLMCFFHLADNNEQVRRGMAGHNPLYKLGSLYRNIVCAFGTVFRPHQHLSLDEGMVPWRGNLSFRVYNPDKPKKYGIKAYMLCDAVTGYCSRFKLYTGKSDTPASANGATYDLVMDMMRGYFGQGYILYMDNYYSSPKLYTDLFVLGCGATGTLRVNRKRIPQRIKDKKVDKGDMFSMCNDELVLVKYHDRKVVYLLSTIEEAAKAPNGRVAPRTGTPIENPAIVNAYNKYMGGVDRSDQMVSYATFNARTLKWWKRVIFHVISLATLNAYLCYKFVTPRKPMLHRVFRKQLVTELLQSVNRACVPGMCTKPVGRPSTAAEPIMRLQGQHFPIKIVGTGKKRNISRACVVCSVAERQRLEAIGEKRKRTGKESSYQCDKCLTALCVEPCFKLFHTHKDYIAAYKTRVMIDE